MQCNIDSRGKAARLIWGIVCVLVGVVLIVLGALQVLAGWWLWALAAVFVLGGAFAIFEARKGWCAVRAMGIKTPM